MDITVCSLGDVITDPITGKRATTNQRHLELLDYAVAIEDAGLAGLYIGEHHGLEYVYSSPPVILMAIADRTKTLRLGTGVTLVANLDPLRVAEDYATLDNLTGGRVELCAGRGNIFPDTYKLFGQPMETSVPRFEENLRLLLKLWTEPVIDHWEGQFRPPLHNFRLQPSPLQSPHPTVWVGGGLSQSSAELSAELGLPLMLPVTAFQPPSIFQPSVEAYRAKWAEVGHEGEARVGAVIHANIARTSQEAHSRWEPRYRAYHAWAKNMFLAMGNPPEFFVPFDYEAFTEPEGPCVAGSPAEFIDQLGWLGELFGLEQTMLCLDFGGTPLDVQLEQVELLGAEVVPALSKNKIPA